MPEPGKFESVRFGNYLLVSRLGAGGMAEVFKARVGGVRGFEKVVCVKRILGHHLREPHFVEMFVHEAKVSARLSHPNIIQVFDLGEVGGEFYMAMEFVAGVDLLKLMRACVAARRPAPSPLAAYVAREMCRALAYAHDFVDEAGMRAPIIHRDVSPQNVMVSYDGQVKLVDFGIAKAAEMSAEQTRTGIVKGKFAYIAPEQLVGAKASAQSDIWAVGVTLFEMLTGQRLFKGESDLDTLNRVRTLTIPRPSQIAAEVPAELDRIVALALARDPAERYARAATMARDLEQHCAREGFTSEEIKEFMAERFPQREVVPDGVAVPTPSGSPSSGAPRALHEQSTALRVDDTPIPTLDAALLITATHTAVAPADAALPVTATRTTVAPADAALPVTATRTTVAPPEPLPDATAALPVGAPTVARRAAGRTGLTAGVVTMLLIAGIASAALLVGRHRGGALDGAPAAPVPLAPRAAPVAAGSPGIAVPAPVAAAPAHLAEEPAPVAAAPAPTAAAPAPVAAGPPPVAAAPAPVAAAPSLLLKSVPPGAEVLDGARLLGATPVEIRFTGGRHSIKLHIEKRGFEPIDQEVTPADGPEATYRLSAHHHRERAAPTGQPRVPVFDDGPTP